MTGNDLIALGFNSGPEIGLALRLADAAKLDEDQIKQRLAAILADPAGQRGDPHFGELADLLARRAETVHYVERPEPAPYQSWGVDLEPQAVQQMRYAVDLPISVRGALMPDAHLGYGLPVGGVLATDNAVIPYAVGVDIACRMKLSIFDVSPDDLKKRGDHLTGALERETRFGIGVEYKKPLDHEVVDADWTVSPVTRRFRQKAHNQLGTSGSGNHFVEWGTLTFNQPDLGMEPGTYLALLSHSGSRGTGASVADYYSKLAMEKHPELPKELRHLAWLDMASDAGQEYWAAMELMGLYASANHDLIHRRVAKAAGFKPAVQVENHHNFAWREQHDGREVIVHRKGATPAGVGVLGVIPGSMATPGYVVRGRGNAASLRSASHGAGRVMSRTAAKNTFRWNHVKPELEAAGVTLLSAGIDEAPGVYKDIHAVMAAQTDLVEVVAEFNPKIVKMAPPGDRAED